MNDKTFEVHKYTFGEFLLKMRALASIILMITGFAIFSLELFPNYIDFHFGIIHESALVRIIGACVVFLVGALWVPKGKKSIYSTSAFFSLLCGLIALEALVSLIRSLYELAFKEAGKNSIILIISIICFYIFVYISGPPKKV